MNSINLRVRYRPVRIGWCIRDNNFEDLRRAMRLSHLFRGGIFNPIIPVGAAHATEMVRRFRVDVLMDICDDPQIKAFSDGIDGLPWPLTNPALFKDSFGRPSPRFLDVSHVLNSIAADRPIAELYAASEVPGNLPESNPYILVHWKEDDPLSDILLATVGGYPVSSDVGCDYESFFRESLRPLEYWAKQDEQLPAHYLEKVTPSQITDEGLSWDRIPGDATIGFYFGKSDNFEDIVNYWNLRVCGVNLLFLDPAHSHRLSRLSDSHWESIRRTQSKARHTENTVAIWCRSQGLVAQHEFSPQMVPYFRQIEGTDVVAGPMRPPLHYLSEKRILASLSERFDRPTLSFQLPEKPFWIPDEWELHDQHFVVSLRGLAADPDASNTFWTPFIPEMNQWLGRKIHLHSNDVRAEQDGVGIICPVTEDNLEISSIGKYELAERLFDFAGISAGQSLPGRIASRLISQLGGLQGCRVLKIAGVRRLIKEHSALQEFDWNKAIRTIAKGDSALDQPAFTEYENLFIGTRNMESKLTPEDVFHYLLRKEVFRVGLTVLCPNCELSFWVHLDDVSTQLACFMHEGSRSGASGPGLWR